MSTQKLAIITKTGTNLTKNIYFVNRLVSSSSLVTALDAKFEFDKDYEVNKRNMISLLPFANLNCKLRNLSFLTAEVTFSKDIR